MSQRSDPATWARLRGAEACVICRRGAPGDLLVELEASWVTVGEPAPMRGYACLVFRRHAVELHDLSEAEGAAFMRDIRRLSAAVQHVTGAVKLNYAVHGNTIPHLHMHVYPRYPGDPFEGAPITPAAVGRPVYAPGELLAVRARLREALLGQDARAQEPPPGLRIDRLDARPPADCLGPLIVESEREGLRFVRRLADEWTSGANRFDRPGETLLVATLDGRLVGVCGLNVDPYAARPEVGRVRHLYVMPESRRLGVGRELVTAVVAAARGRVERLRLRTTNPAAARLYERLGFRPSPGVPDCTHVMELGPGSRGSACTSP